LRCDGRYSDGYTVDGGVILRCDGRYSDGYTVDCG
jgi:hypothetical protein